MIDNLAMEITGVNECISLLQRVKDKKAKAAIRSAISRAGTILLQTARPLVPSSPKYGTGLLRRSLGKKDSNQFAKRA